MREPAASLYLDTVIAFQHRIHHRSCVFGVLLFLMVLSCPVLAQGPVYVGASAGYEFGIPLIFQREPGVINGYNFDGQGISESNGRWFGFYFGTPQLGEDPIGFVVRLKYMVLAAKYLSAPFTGDPEFNPVTGTIETRSYELELIGEARMWEVDVAYNHLFAGLWALELGAWYSRRSNAEFTKTYRPLTPLPGNPLEPATVETGSHLGSDPNRFGLMLTVGVNIPITSWLTIQPELYTKGDVMAFGENVGLQAFSVGVGGSLLLDITRRDTVEPPPHIAPPPAVIESLPPRTPPRLVASVDLYSLDQQGVRVQASAMQPHSVLRRLQMPFPSVLFFDAGATELPARYNRLSAAEARFFSIDSLVRLEPEQVYQQGLNLLGLRLRQHRAARVTLVGSASEDEPASLARLRAEGVREYLSGIWGVNRERISVRTATSAHSGGTVSGETADEMRSVRIESTPPVLAPVVTEWHTRGYTPLAIDLQPEIEAEAGVREWSVTVRQESRIISRYSSRPEENVSGPQLELHIPDGTADTTLPPLVAELVVEDSAGTRITATDSLALFRREAESQGGVRQIDEKELRSVSVYLLPWNDGAKTGRTWLREIARSAEEDAHIAISPLWGEMCAPCEEVAGALKPMLKRKVTVATTLRGESPAPGNLPEQRRLGQLVRVEIEENPKEGRTGRP